MKRPLALAALLAGLVFPSHLNAQMRFASRTFAPAPVRMPGGFAPIRSMPGPAMPGPAMTGRVSWGPMRPGPVRTGPMRPAPWGGLPARFGGVTRVPHVAPGYFIGTPCYTNPSYSGSFFCSQFLPHHRRRPFFGQTQFVPSYYGYYPPAFYSGEEAPAMAPAQDNALASQVEDLSSEVEMLREQQSSREDSRPVLAAPQVAIPEKTLPTVFAYHDGHQFETQNYAILDQTLWVFGGQTTRKIPLAELDLAATKKLNDERGVDFSPPQAR